MTLNRTLLCIIFVFTSLFALSQESTIQGIVRDQETNETLVAGHVVIKELNIGTSTNDVGAFFFDEITPGNYTLEVSYIGFAKKSIPIVIGSSENEYLDIDMKPSAIRIEDIEVNQNPLLNAKSIAALDLKLRPISNSQEVLKIVPGLFIAQHAGGGKAEQIFLRGFDIDHGTDISLKVDGMPVNMVSHAHGQGYSDLHFLIPETIKRVEFDKGSYYAKEGNFNTAGYANFSTRDRLEQNSLKLEVGQFGTFRTVGMFNLINSDDKNKPSLFLATEYSRTDGYFESPQDFNRFNALLKFQQNISPNKTLTLSASGFSSRWDASGQIPVRAVEDGTITRFGAIDDTEGGKTSRFNLNSKMTTRLKNGGYMENQLFFNRYDFNLVSNFTFFLNDPVYGDQITQTESRDIIGSNNSYWFSNPLFGLAGSTEIGTGFRYDMVNDNSLARTFQKTEVIDQVALGDVREFNYFAFIEEQVDLSSKLSLIAGLRYDLFNFDYSDQLKEVDDNPVTEGILSPKLQLGYQLTSSLNIYAKTGIGYHSNDSRVVVAQQGQQILPKAFGWDIGTIWKPIDRLMVNIAAWRLSLDQEFVYVGDEGIVEPSGATLRSGIDLSLKYQINDWLFFNTDLNITDPRSLEEEGQNFIPLAPTFTSIGSLYFKSKRGISSSLNYRYLDNRPANEDYSVTAEGYFLLDAKVNYTIGNYDFGLTIENVTNTEWREAQFETESRLRNESASVSEIHFTPGTPFQARLSATVKF